MYLYLINVVCTYMCSEWSKSPRIASPLKIGHIGCLKMFLTTSQQCVASESSKDLIYT